ncbi:MAG: ABC transporter ATP-binding protein [Hyphomicrobiaceae bacterium]
MSKLVLSNVVRRYGTTTAVAGVDLTLAEGEFVSLLGPSGCGKTTTLRMIAGFIPPSEGTISIEGQLVSTPTAVVPPERRNMSMIFQSYAIWPNMTVEQNVGFGLELRKIGSAEIKRRVGEILEVVQMGHLAKRYPAELSGGQQQRVALARAIVVKPAVLLLDEPLSNLDANLREEMRFEIRRLHDEFRITTVYVTHDQAEAMVTSDRVAVMNEGRVEQIDAPYNVYNRPRTRFVAGFIGRTNFVEATNDGTNVAFDGFTLPAADFDPEVRSASGPLVFSVRPQSLSLGREATGTAVRAKVVQRAYLGDAWDYLVQPDGSGLRLRVAAAPAETFDVEEAMWLRLQPGQMAVVK